MDAILSLGGASAVLTGLSPISSNDFSAGNNPETIAVPSGAKLAVFYSIGFDGSSGEEYISIYPITVAVPSSESMYVIATGLQAADTVWKTGIKMFATLSSTSLEIHKQVQGMVLWLG